MANDAEMYTLSEAVKLMLATDYDARGTLAALAHEDEDREKDSGIPVQVLCKAHPRLSRLGAFMI